MALEMILLFLSLFKFCNLSTSQKLQRCSSLQMCMVLLHCSLVRFVLSRWSSLSEVASLGFSKVICKGWLEVTAGYWSIDSSEKLFLSDGDWFLISISFRVSVGKSSIVKSIAGCGTLFWEGVVDEMVLGSVTCWCGYLWFTCFWD